MIVVFPDHTHLLFSTSSSVANLLKFNIVVRICLLYLCQIIDGFFFGIEVITTISLNIPGKLMILVSLLTN